MSLPTALHLGVDVSSRRPLRDEAYATLRRAILSGIFHPGDRLVQHDVADRLGLSRSPVREALQRLVQEGLVEANGQGLIVRGLDSAEVAELYGIRIILESHAARLAAQNFRPGDLPRFEVMLAEGASALAADDNDGVALAGRRLHEAIASVAGNHRLAQMLISISEETDRFRRMTLSHRPRGATALEEHRVMVDALAAHDEDLAAKVMHDHVGAALLDLQSDW